MQAHAIPLGFPWSILTSTAQLIHAQPQGDNMAQQRITIKLLQVQCDRLNRITGNKLESYSKDEVTGKYIANIGAYSISQAYGGYCLHQIVNNGGGVSSPLSSGHVSARELSGLLSAYIAGINAATKD